MQSLSYNYEHKFTSGYLDFYWKFSTSAKKLEVGKKLYTNNYFPYWIWITVTLRDLCTSRKGVNGSDTDG
jgi:hypothetical protein